MTEHAVVFSAKQESCGWQELAAAQLAHPGEPLAINGSPFHQFTW